MRAMNLKRIILLLALFTLSAVAFAQTATRVTPGESNQTKLDELRAQGYEALYNLDYETANRAFKEMVRLFPDHPAGPQCLAATLWLQELNRSRERQASLYSTESFYAGDEKADPHLVEQFHNLARTAAQLA